MPRARGKSSILRALDPPLSFDFPKLSSRFRRAFAIESPIKLCPYFPRSDPRAAGDPCRESKSPRRLQPDFNSGSCFSSARIPDRPARRETTTTAFRELQLLVSVRAMHWLLTLVPLGCSTGCSIPDVCSVSRLPHHHHRRRRLLLRRTRRRRRRAGNNRSLYQRAQPREPQEIDGSSSL